MEVFSDEHELVLRTAQGDEQAFTALYRKHKQPVYRFAYLMTGAVSHADDITQETFLTLMREAARFDPRRGTLLGWLRGVARHHVLRHLERDSRYAELRDTPVDTLTERSLDQARIRHAVLMLPAHYREAVVLCDFEGLKYDEAAAVLQVAPGTVASRVHRGHQILAETFGVVK